MIAHESIRTLMRAPIWSALVAVLLSPFYISANTTGQVGYDHTSPYEPDTLKAPETRFEITGGHGGYASVRRGCDGRAIRADQVHFTDIGASVEHEFPNRAVVGVRGGRIREWMEDKDVPDEFEVDDDLELISDYVNPNFAMNGDAGAVGVGLFLMVERQPGGIEDRFDKVPAGDFIGHDLESHKVSFHSRVGSLHRNYLWLSYNEGLPLYTAGTMRTGLGFNPSPHFGAQLGVNWARPNDRLGGYFDLDYRATPVLTVGLRSRFGHTASKDESALGFRAQYRWVH